MFLCWPPTKAGTETQQTCPKVRLSDFSQVGSRTCGNEGMWLTKEGVGTAVGWTNYTPCFPAQVNNLLFKFYDSQDAENAQYKYEIVRRTRILEIGGFLLSLIFLVMSVAIFLCYRTLRNNRTNIHICLFLSMTVQVIIRLVLYIDQAFARNIYEESKYDALTLPGIDNIPYLCEGTYVALEYATTVMFLWMFIEGLYLHNVVTGNALRERNSLVLYYAMGWGLPFVNILIWAVLNSYYYAENQVMRCWYAYNFQQIYWIIQIPRIAVICCNFCFLFNIIRVLIVKLRRSENTEVEKVRKAVRAALFLLPLLGLTNILNMTEAPLDGPVWQFAIWSYSTHFLRSFQGFFVAVLYCFLNGEVREVLGKSYNDFMVMHPNAQRRSNSLFNFMSSSDETRDQRILHRVPTPSKPSWMLVRRQRLPRFAVIGGTPDDIEMGQIRRPDMRITAPASPNLMLLRQQRLLRFGASANIPEDIEMGQIRPDPINMDLERPGSSYDPNRYDALERAGSSYDNGSISGSSSEDLEYIPRLAPPKQFLDTKIEIADDIDNEESDDDDNGSEECYHESRNDLRQTLATINEVPNRE